MVVKKDGRREQFERQKLVAGIKRACQKRTVAAAQIDAVADEVERGISEKGEKEVESRELGDLVMSRLRDIDSVAYIRFASVYRSFSDVEEFMQEIRSMEAHCGGEEIE